MIDYYEGPSGGPLYNICTSGSSFTYFNDSNQIEQYTYGTCSMNIAHLGFDITYDDNGNMTNHPIFKNIGYNYLDQVESYDQDNQNDYDASHTADGVLISEGDRDFIGPFEFVNSSLFKIYYQNGYVDNSNDWNFYLRDHLGNIRVVFSDKNADNAINSIGDVIEEYHYYPFGLQFNGPWLGVQNHTNEMQFNGIRFHESDYNDNMGHADLRNLGLSHAKYRSLDPVMGMWLQIDPRSEELFGFSPYNSFNNNPILFGDPEGDFVFTPLLAIGIGAAIGGIGGGINAVNNGQSFLSGFGKGALIGGLSSTLTLGVGSAFGAVSSNILNEIGRAGAHGLVNGFTNELSGGSFSDGLLSGSISSLIGSSFDGSSSVGQTIGSGLAGGLSSLASGGSFLQGAGHGLIISALNHQSHGDPNCPDCIDGGNYIEVTISAKRPKYIGSLAAVTSFIGAGASGFSYNHVNNGNYKGVNGNYYSIRSQGWNQYTGTKAHMNKTITKATVSGLASKGIGVAGMANTTYNWQQGKLTNTAYTIEMISAGISTFAPAPVSIPWTIGYEGLGRNGIARFEWYQKRFKPWLRNKFGG